MPGKQKKRRGNELPRHLETLQNVAPTFTVLVTNADGLGDTDYGLMLTHSSTTGAGLTVDLSNTTTNNFTDLGILTSTGDATIALNSTGAVGGGVSFGATNLIDNISETDNALTTVTVTSDANAYLLVPTSESVGATEIA